MAGYAIDSAGNLTIDGSLTVAGVVASSDIRSAIVVYARSGSGGYVELRPGDATHTGYLDWVNAAGGREGFFGFATTTGGGDAGTIPMTCGTFALSGAMTATGGVNNLTGGAAGSFPYQTAAAVTAMLAAGTSSQVLVSGATPAWTNTPTLTGTNFTGVPAAGLLNPVSSSGVTGSSFNTVETYVTPAFTFPAAFLAVGQRYRITLYGTCTSSVANLVTFTVRVGTAGTTADTAIVALTPTSFAGGSALPWHLTCDFMVTATGTSGTGIAHAALLNVQSTAGAGISNGTGLVGISGTATINTTTATHLGMSLKTAASTTSLVIFSASVEMIK